MGEQVGTKLFIAIASIFIVLVVALIVIAVVKGNEEIEQLKNAGDNSNPGFFNRVSEGLNGDDSEEIITNNVPDPVLVADPDGDDDDDGIPNSQDIDVNGDGELNSDEEAVILKCGDSNGDDILDQSDLDAIVSYAFGGKEVPIDVRADLNADGVIDILDVVMMVDHVRRGEPEPTCTSDSALKSYEDLICGDTNGDGTLNQVDLDAITGYAFGGVEIPVGVKADLNGDGVVDILDVSLMTNHVRRGAAAPTCGEVSNQAPIINSFTGPKYFRLSTLSPQMQVILNNNSWIISASDPNGGSLNYNVTWGDGTANSYSGASGNLLTVWHSYGDSGKYTLTMNVKDTEGLSANANKIIEIPYTTTPFFCDFSSNNSIGVNIGDTIIARDPQGILSGVSNEITSNGIFFVRTVGDDPLTSGVDEGASSGNAIKFYENDEECVLVNGSNTWADRCDKKITLDCS